ncbi:1-phosphofructokinase [Helicobacter kayseriensis]|uniref:1-phosphofructokinase n=1 Tax=Helicobacter kayseriensis TaxID=2905877 RepID=UPI001E5D8B44|nr:1-phosphofructokinase [Helicobacter kayseriensis]MCE3046842.1 1-phosphofructokinase [Helicobacter kayseriensis]MCE3047856.1 1-phosphofructokinase [Helicobacter kayseriensis]
MIFTLTLNPSLDYILKVCDFKLGQTNRSNEAYLLPAGKGINVSLMLKNLGYESTLLGFLAGFSGAEIDRSLRELGVIGDFIFLDHGHSRINVKLSSTQESEINASGPKIEQKDLEKLFAQLDCLSDGDILVMSGSLPIGVDQGIYAFVMQRYEKRNLKMIIDCSGEALQKTLPFRPYLIKPNRSEVEEFFSLQNPSLEELKQCAIDLCHMGAQNTIISLAGEGAIFATNHEALHISAPCGKVKNSVGAGDSMVAGMIAGIERGMSEKEAFLYAVSCGSASAFSDGFAKLEDVEKIFKILKENQ